MVRHPFVSRLVRVVVAVYYLEIGAFLVLVPWSRMWNERVAGRSPRAVADAVASPFFRGFVTGLGFLHLAGAVREIESWRRGREGRRPRGVLSPVRGTGSGRVE
ncbi:MAG: hypothetical protein EDX89_21800 [Acidobacteria bacterium]|nr:MAG: hypothetical protein EDX89_21800 [Acidobacteriota bacterium]MCE7960089.1 hypothetical protein [Acidobacteria bacterium ACB2]